MQCAESGHFREEAFPSVSLTVYLNQTMAELLHILKHPSQEHASPLLWAQFLLVVLTESLSQKKSSMPQSCRC